MGKLIIPYQELLGNYDHLDRKHTKGKIIPYQELLGNYDSSASALIARLIIPYQELLGNYDVARFQCEGGLLYHTKSY